MRPRARSGQLLSVALIDIDHFKKVNDTLGHAAGDEVLRAVSATLGHASRTSDVCARWGGEEFLVFLPDTGEPGALICAERLRSAVEEMSLPSGRITISLGVAEWDRNEEIGQTVSRADEALYRAKATGRNRVGA